MGSLLCVLIEMMKLYSRNWVFDYVEGANVNFAQISFTSLDQERARPLALKMCL